MRRFIFVINSCNHASLCRGSDGYIFFWNHVFGEENSTRTIYLFSREENLFSSLLMRGKVQMSCRKQELAPAAWSYLNISDYPRNIQGKKFCIQLSSCSDSYRGDGENEFFRHWGLQVSSMTAMVPVFKICFPLYRHLSTVWDLAPNCCA